MHHWWHNKLPSAVRDFLQRFVFLPWCRQFCTTRAIDGLENLDNLEQPVIFVANHASHADTVMILSALPPAIRKRLAIAAAQDYFYKSSVKGAIFSLFLNTVPFDRNDGNASLEECTTLLHNGWSLLIYPEGTRSIDGSIGRFKKGVGAVAARLGVAVVPIYVEGCRGILPKGQVVPRKNHVRISFGKPVVYTQDQRLGWIANDLRERVIAMQSPEMINKCA